MTTSFYAAIESTNCTGTVYGIGEDPEAALADAREWLDESEGTADLITVPCTPAAAAYVRERGGASSTSLTVSRTGVCLRSEEE